MADEVGLSTTPTLRRVRQMEQTGIIRGYAARLDETRLIGEMPVFIMVTLERQTKQVLETFREIASELPELMGGYMLSGRVDFILHAFVPDLEHYRCILEKLTAIEGIAHVQSSFVLKTFLSRSAPILA